MKLSLSYFRNEDTLFLSRDLLGKFLFTDWNEGVTGGMIVETEAYMGPEDKASHAYGNRRTNRTDVMFRSGGVCYVYFCYGMHYLFNIVTHREGIPHAILIRALEPTHGLDIMLQRCQKENTSALTSGPARLTKALGINEQHSGIELENSPIWIEDRGVVIKKDNIVASPRIGIDYAQEYILKPWRFTIKDNPWTSM